MRARSTYDRPLLNFEEETGISSKAALDVADIFKRSPKMNCTAGRQRKNGPDPREFVLEKGNQMGFQYWELRYEASG